MQNQNNIWKNIDNQNKRIKTKFFKRKKIEISQVEKTVLKNSKSHPKNKFLKKKRGRKKLNDSDNSILIVKHDRNSDDNLKRKVKTHFHNYIIALLNSKLKLEPGKEKLKFVKINSEITQNITIEFNQNLFKKPIKDIIVQTSEKYQNKNINRECLSYIMSTESINYEVINLLNKTYEDMYFNYYLKSTKDSFDSQPNESYESHKEKLKKFGNEYLNRYIQNAENLLKFYATAKKRQSKKRKSDENENNLPLISDQNCNNNNNGSYYFNDKIIDNKFNNNLLNYNNNFNMQDKFTQTEINRTDDESENI
jgi:hypothetical protein